MGRFKTIAQIVVGVLTIGALFVDWFTFDGFWSTLVLLAGLLPLGVLLGRQVPEAQAKLRRLVFLYPYIVFLVVAQIVNGSQEPGRETFYTVAAEILPVLILAFAIERRTIVRGAIEFMDFLYATFAFALMGVGEFDALRIVAGGAVNNHHFSVVCGALAAGLASISLLGLLRDDSAAAEEPNRS